MGWTEHQRAMLGEMGIRVWGPAAEPAAPAAPPSAAQQTAAQGATANPLPASAVPSIAPRTPSAAAPRPAAEPGMRPLGVAGMDWTALREAVAGCNACTLCSGRTQTVFGVGNPHAHWMIVGEAPGEQEDLKGEPFVGKSGQLLDNMLRAVGLTRDEAAPEAQVYIANTVKCRPPGNRNPEPAELAQCEPFLMRQVALVRPRIILAMGRFAVQSLLRSTEPIGRLRGRVHQYEGVPLVVTYHPAYLLRNPEDKARAWDDLCLAREVLLQAKTPPA